MYRIFFRNSKGNAFCEIQAQDAFNAECAFNALSRTYRTVVMYRDDDIVKQYDNDF